MLVTRVTPRLSHVEQELPTLPEHVGSPPVFSGVRVARSLVLCVIFCRLLFVLCPFSFGDCIFCPSNFSHLVSSIKTFDFPTLYTTLLHDKLKTCLKETIHKAFSHRNYGSKFVVLGYNSTYFSNKIQKGKHAIPRNKWSVCWSSSSIAYFSPLEGHCFSRSSAYQWVRIVPLF